MGRGEQAQDGGGGKVMSELSEQVKREVFTTTITGSSLLRQLLDEHEALEADLDINAMKIRQLEAEHERICADHATVTTDLEGVTLMLANTSFELRRLEGLVRAWVNARGDDESEAAIELWREACRLAEEKT